MQEGKSVVVFCGTRARVETAAVDLQSLCKAGLLAVSERCTGLASDNKPGNRAALLKDLPRNTPDNLRQCFEHGIGFHHAGAVLVTVAAQGCCRSFNAAAKCSHPFAWHRCCGSTVMLCAPVTLASSLGSAMLTKQLS
jgi:hypothetical protein